MTPATIIREAQAEGVRLTLSPTGTIKATGDGATVNRWLTVIREHKAEIVDVLKVGTDDTATRSIGWVHTFPDGGKVEVCLPLPATRNEVLQETQAQNALPIEHLPLPAQIASCTICQHVTGRGGCGVPVKAGLSEREGVIRYHSDNGKTCPAWLKRLDSDLERRILAMAEHWHYSGDELAIALDGARSDPDGWRRVVKFDEMKRG